MRKAGLNMTGNNNIKNKKKVNTIKFSIANYMLQLVLPELQAAYGHMIVSVYLQAALHINHQKKSGFKGTCFMSAKKYAENIGCSVKTVNLCLNRLENIGLLEKQGVYNYNRFRVEELKNNSLPTKKEIVNFNDTVVNYIRNDETANVDRFDKFAAEIKKFLNVSGVCIAANKFFDDVNLLRNWILEAEKIHRGSSLFFITNIAPFLFKGRVHEEVDLSSTSLKNRARRTGMSASTICRMLYNYVDKGCLVDTNNVTTIGTKIYSIHNVFAEPENHKIMNVVKDMNTNFICPVCNKSFKSARGVKTHIIKDKSAEHLAYKQKQDEEQNKVSQSKKLMTEIKCSECNIPCKDCYVSWRDCFNDCNNKEKVLFVKAMNESNKDNDKLVVHANEAVAVEAEQEQEHKSVKAKKACNQDSPYNLVQYFYRTYGGVSYNVPREMRQVSCMLKLGVTPDCIRAAMDLMHLRGSKDLRYFGRYAIKDAVDTQRLLEEAEKENTLPSLIKMYYEGMGLSLKDSDIVKDMERLERIKNEKELNFKSLEMIIKFMIKDRCPVFAYIHNEANKALVINKTANRFQTDITFCDPEDPDYYYKKAISNLSQGKSSVSFILHSYVNEMHSHKDISKDINNILRHKQFSNDLNALAWGWKVKYPFNKKSFAFAKKISVTEPKLDKYDMQDFLIWLKDQEKKFVI